MEDIFVRSKIDAVVIFLDFKPLKKHQNFYNVYNSSYVSMKNSTFYDGHHPDLKTMNETSINLKILIQKGLDYSLNIQIELNQHLVMNKFVILFFPFQHFLKKKFPSKMKTC